MLDGLCVELNVTRAHLPLSGSTTLQRLVSETNLLLTRDVVVLPDECKAATATVCANTPIFPTGSFTANMVS